MSVTERMLYIMEQKNIKPVKLAEFLNINQSVISNWKTRNTNPPTEFILQICEFLDVSVFYLLSGKKESPTNNMQHHIVTRNNIEIMFNELNEKYQERILERMDTYLEEQGIERNIIKFEDIAPKKPFKFDNEKIKHDPNVMALNDYQSIRDVEAEKYKYETNKYGKISAGDGIEVFEDIEKIKSPVSCDFALIVDGDSMEPMFVDGQTIYLKKQDHIDYSGQILAVQIEDDIGYYKVFLKKIYYTKNMIRLLSLNSKYEDKYLRTNQVKIIGCVIQ